ncbi:hypothetical protein GCM10027299_33940 [Larkinella ripae]
MLEKLEEIRESIFKYLEARIELFKLETRSQVENVALNAVHGVVLGFLATITTIFLFSLLAAYLNEVLDSRYLGFLIVAGFFLLLTIIWALAKGPVEGMLRKMTYKILKNQQEKKAEDRAEAIQDLMDQTRESLNESGSMKN